MICVLHDASATAAAAAAAATAAATAADAADGRRHDRWAFGLDGERAVVYREQVDARGEKEREGGGGFRPEAQHAALARKVR